MCTYQKTNGEPPWCTHDCNGCVWWRDDEIKETFINIEAQNKKEIRNQLEYIKEFLEDHQENWYVYETLRDELRQLEIMLKREQVI